MHVDYKIHVEHAGGVMVQWVQLRIQSHCVLTLTSLEIFS